MNAAWLTDIVTESKTLMQKAQIWSTDKTQSYLFSITIFSDVVLLSSVSGKKSLDIQRAAGADIIEAVRMCAGWAPKLMYAASTEPGIWRVINVIMDTASSHTVPGYDITSQCHILAFFDYLTLKTKALDIVNAWIYSPSNTALHSEDLSHLQSAMRTPHLKINFLLYPSQYFYASLEFISFSIKKEVPKYMFQISIMSAGICFYIEFFFDKHLHSKCEISINCNI